MAKTAAKGTIDNPYSMSECEKMLDAGTWPGGYVRDDAGTVSYVMKSVTVQGYSGSGSGSNWHGSDFEFCSGSYEWHEPDTDKKGCDEEGKGTPSGNEGGGTDTGGNAGGGAGGGGNISSQVIFAGRFSSLSAYTKSIIKNLKGYTGTVYVTSTARTPESQARAMLDNIKKTSVEAQKKLYASPGDMVIDKYRNDRNDEENIREMLAEINRVGPSKVSKHCADPKVMNVFDVSRSKLNGVESFIGALKNANIYFIDEPQNGCVHVEIPQK